ncbi:MAG: phosphatase PAP2 family protein [Acidimicrobiia bacterium]
MPLPQPDDIAAIARFDEVVDEFFERLRGHPPIDRFFYTLSTLGDWSLIWHLTGSAAGVASGDHDAAIRLSAALGIESLLVNQGIKRLFRRSRPVHDRDQPHDLRKPSTSSFPSGHASAAACAAVLLTDRYPKAAPLWWALAAGVATSRIHVRLHHASDVVGGAAVGVALGMAAKRAWPLPR